MACLQGVLTPNKLLMTIKAFIPVSLLLAPLLLAGCTHTDEGDTSPLPPQNAQTRIETATKKIEESKMTPEQKKAALDYIKRGNAGAQSMKQNAQPQGQTAPGK